MGGSIGQQMARSLLMQGADKVTGLAVEANERVANTPHSIQLSDPNYEPYWASFVRLQLPDPQPQPIIEPLPVQRQSPAQLQAISSRLVTVEVWNLVVGEEKQALLQRSLNHGSSILPSPADWSSWQVAEGVMQSQANQTIYFLLPPDFGRVRTGDKAVIEIAEMGGLHIARHRAD